MTKTKRKGEKMKIWTVKNVLSLLVLFIFLLLVIVFFWASYLMDDIFGDPDEILSRYKIGSHIDSMNINEQEIVLKYKAVDKFQNVNILIYGYKHPDKYLEKNQELLVIDTGYYFVYLYFDEKGILIDKEIVGS